MHDKRYHVTGDFKKVIKCWLGKLCLVTMTIIQSYIVKNRFGDFVSKNSCWVIFGCLSILYLPVVAHIMKSNHFFLKV